MLRLIRWSATGLVVVVVLTWAVVWLARADPGGRAAVLVRAVSAWLDGSAPAVDVAGVGGPFDLIDSDGRAVTDKTYRGKWLLVYFGYTYCPDICPTTLQTMSEALDQMGGKAAAIAPLFITVDPARDTPAAMGQYTALFDPRLIGLTGTPAQVKAAKMSYRVYSRIVSSSGNAGYMVDHSSYVYLMGPDGKLKSMFPDGVTAADMVETMTASMSVQK